MNMEYAFHSSVADDKGISNRAHKDGQVAAFGEVTIEPHFMLAGTWNLVLFPSGMQLSFTDPRAWLIINMSLYLVR